MTATAHDANAPLRVSSHLEINGSLPNDTIVQGESFLHVRGNVTGSLTIEKGAKVVVEGFVDGKIINRGGQLVINNNALAGFFKTDGPPEAEAGGVLRINLSAIALNWGALARRTVAECAAVVRADAYGCGIDLVTSALAKSGCRTFFVSDLAEAKRVRAATPDSSIYVLNGLYPGTGPTFAHLNAQPVIRSLTEMAEWNFFVTSSGWTGGFALEVDTSSSQGGISVEEATALATRFSSGNDGITLLMGQLGRADSPNRALSDRQIKLFRDLHGIYRGIPASLANSSGIFYGPEAHFNVVRAGSALYGINPTPGNPNPMLPVVELQARIVQVGSLMPGEKHPFNSGWAAKRQMRLAVVSIGRADGYPRSDRTSKKSLHAIVGGKFCPIVGDVSIDRLAIDITDVPNPKAARRGEMVTLIGGQISVDDLAAATGLTGYDVLASLRRRLHNVYYAS